MDAKVIRSSQKAYQRDAEVTSMMQNKLSARCKSDHQLSAKLSAGCKSYRQDAKVTSRMQT
eukprot:5787487-Pleurochrysis_carterae.AAC.1